MKENWLVYVNWEMMVSGAFIFLMDSNTSFVAS